VLSANDGGRITVAVFVVLMIMLAILILTFSAGWGGVLIAIGSLLIAAFIFKSVQMFFDSDIKRDIAGGQKAVLTGIVEKRIVTHIELVEVRSIRVRMTHGACETFPAADTVYDNVRVNEAIELSCLPVSRMLLSIRTRSFSWKLG
jgi:hypothetical protein